MYFCRFVDFYFVYVCTGFFFFFKQKTAYEMRISEWSSDVCSSDLYSFAVKVTDNVGATQVKSYSGTVAAPDLTLTPSASQGSVGTPFSVTYAPGGGVVPYHDPALEFGASLPPGLTLSGFTLSGTPTTTGTYSFQIV